jgi:hypothetical protein
MHMVRVSVELEVARARARVHVRTRARTGATDAFASVAGFLATLPDIDAAAAAAAGEPSWPARVCVASAGCWTPVPVRVGAVACAGTDRRRHMQRRIWHASIYETLGGLPLMRSRATCLSSSTAASRSILSVHAHIHVHVHAQRNMTIMIT